MSKKVILVGIVAAASLCAALPARAEGRIHRRQEPGGFHTLDGGGFNLGASGSGQQTNAAGHDEQMQ